MSGELAADVMTGALIAHAVEPRAGEQHGHASGDLCLNCGTRLIGEHCHRCGQSAHVHRTIGAIGHELLHGVFHFEGKAIRTLPLLFLRPGELTRRYVAGERARFVSPLALFLFTVFLMFAVISAFGPVEFGKGFDTKLGGAEQAVVKGRADARVAVEQLERRRQAALAGRASTAAVDKQLTQAKEDLRLLDNVQASMQVDTTGDTIRVGSKHEWLTNAVRKVRANPGLFAYRLQSTAYKYSWLLIPISTPFVALLFMWRRRFGLYDHAVFVTYSLAFMTLLVVALTLLGVVGVSTGALATAALILPPLHMYKQMRGAYSLRRLSALWRTAALIVFATCALGTFGGLLLFHELAE